MPAYEIMSKRRISRASYLAYSGRRTFVCTAAGAQTFADGKFDTTWGTGADLGGAIVLGYDIEYEPAGLLGLAFVHLKYIYPTAGQNLIGTARLTMRVVTKAVPVKYAGGVPLEADVKGGFNNNYFTRWKVVDGDNYVLESRARFRLELMMAKGDVEYREILGAIGHRNKNTINFHNHDITWLAGRVILRGASVRESYAADYADVRYELDWRSGGWDDTVTTRPHARAFVRQEERKANGDGAGTFKNVLDWIPNKKWTSLDDPVDQDDVTVGLVPEHSMSFLNSSIFISG